MSANLLGWGLVIFCIAAILQAGLLIYVATTKLEMVESAMANSKIVAEARLFWQGGGIVGRLARLTVIFNCLMITRIYVKRGLADSDEVRNLPKKLKLWILIPGINSYLILLTAWLYPDFQVS